MYFGGLRILPEIPGSLLTDHSPAHSRAGTKLQKDLFPHALEKTFCPFPASSLTCTLLNFIPFFVVILQACDGLSAKREGECFRQVEKEAGGEHPDERSCGLQGKNAAFSLAND